MTSSVREYVPLAPFTSLGIGGPSRYFTHANSENTVLEAVGFAAENNLPIFVLGGGSNLLVSDQGYPGLVLKIEIRGREWFNEGKLVRLVAGAGEDWDSIVAECVDRTLFGVECLSGIPGSIGGTPVQNVGAYGQEISEMLSRVRAYDHRTNELVELDRSQCGFSYRKSIFNSIERDRYIVLNMEYRLPKTGVPCVAYSDIQRALQDISRPTIIDVRHAVLRVRSRKAMVLRADDPDSRSAGSFFKNPIVDQETFERIEAQIGEILPRYPVADGKVKTAAAWLIERAGISRGFSMGAAGVSRKHTLALINKGGATAVEVIALAREIRRRVEDRFGVRLIPEPVFVGFDDQTMRVCFEE